MANKKVWELKLHDQVEDPYYEITNGPISLVASCGFIGETEEDEDGLFKMVTNALNDSGIGFHSENALELKQHIEILSLQDENRYLKELLQNFLSRHETGLLPDRFIYEKAHKYLLPDTKNKTV